MKIFIRTIIICAILCLGYYAWVYLGKASYEPVIIPANPDMSAQPSVKIDKTQTGKKVKRSKTVKISLLKDENSFQDVERTLENPSLENVIKELLASPTKTEKSRGFYSEIPNDTKLVWLKDENGKIIINLTKNFAQGGGAKSISNRVKQLIKTVNKYSSKKPVYLYLDGQMVEYMGGEGVFIEQPLNEDTLD